MAVDVAPKKASGAALGVVGIASYIGAGVQDIFSGYLIGAGKMVGASGINYDFSSIRYFWVGAAVTSFVLCSCLWRIKYKK